MAIPLIREPTSKIHTALFQVHTEKTVATSMTMAEVEDNKWLSVNLPRDSGQQSLVDIAEDVR